MRISLLFGLLLATATVVAAADVPKVNPQEASRLVAAGRAVLVDVREPAEWAKTGVAAPAFLLPKSDFDGAQKLWNPFLASVHGREVILYCSTGHRAGRVAEELAAQGFKVADAGGFKDWAGAGLPVRRVDSPH